VRDLLSVFTPSATTQIKPATADFKLPDLFKAYLSKYEYAKYEHWKAEHPKIELWKYEHPEIPQNPIGPDPRFAEIAQGIAGLTTQVLNLSSEVAEMRKAGRG